MLLAAFVARGLCAELLGVLIQRQLDGRDRVFVPQQVHAEFRRHLKSKFKATAEEIGAALEAIALFETGSQKAPLEASLVPDADDLPILAAALSFGAECFVTGDKALLELTRVGDMKVVSPRRLFEILTLPGAA